MGSVHYTNNSWVYRNPTTNHITHTSPPLNSNDTVEFERPKVLSIIVTGGHADDGKQITTDSSLRIHVYYNYMKNFIKNGSTFLSSIGCCVFLHLHN